MSAEIKERAKGMTPFFFRIQVMTVIMFAGATGGMMAEGHSMFAIGGAALTLISAVNLMGNINSIIIALRQ